MRRVRAGRSDRGAVAAIVATVLASGMVVALGALVIDTGQAYFERAQLQNGADAAALAVARACAHGPSYCDTTTTSTSVAGAAANQNAKDQTSTVTVVCGRDPFAKLPACAAPDPSLKLSCGTAPATSVNYAEVRVETRSSTGTRVLPPVFGNAALGSHDTGITVHACARAKWGIPSSARGLAMTISYCEWLAYIGGVPSLPVYAVPPPAIPPILAERVLYFHNTNPLPTHCIAGPSGADIPGDFGQTVTQPGTCTSVFNFNPASGTTTYPADPGTGLSNDCKTALASAQQSHEVTFVPIYINTTGTGSGGTYQLWSMAAFVVTGYFWPSWSAKSWLTGKQPCNGSARCVSGYFTTGLTGGGQIGSSTGAGANVVQLLD